MKVIYQELLMQQYLFIYLDCGIFVFPTVKKNHISLNYHTRENIIFFTFSNLPNELHRFNKKTTTTTIKSFFLVQPGLSSIQVISVWAEVWKTFAATFLNTVHSMSFGLCNISYKKLYVINSTTTFLSKYNDRVTCNSRLLMSSFPENLSLSRYNCLISVFIQTTTSSTTNQTSQIPVRLGWNAAKLRHSYLLPYNNHGEIDISVRALSPLCVLPEHLGDGKHEAIVEYDAQGAGEEVRAELACQRPEQEEARALLLLQLPEELSLVWQSAPQRHTRRQGLLLPASGRKCTQLQTRLWVSEMPRHGSGAFQAFNVKQIVEKRKKYFFPAITDGLNNLPAASKSHYAVT